MLPVPSRYTPRPGGGFEESGWVKLDCQYSTGGFQGRSKD